MMMTMMMMMLRTHPLLILLYIMGLLSLDRRTTIMGLSSFYRLTQGTATKALKHYYRPFIAHPKPSDIALAAQSTNTDNYFSRPGPWDESDLSSLLDANKAWSARMTASNPDFFNDFKMGHAPKILWIGCSDARVPANEIIGEPAGSVFVHRNVANMVVNTDFNCMSVIQYAVDVLKVKHIIVCGHYDCGGIRAALEPIDHKSPLENWLRNIRDTYRLHKEELNAIVDSRDRQRRLVELNVVEQCLNIYKTAVVQRRRIDTHSEIGNPGSPHTFAEPRVHAFVYEPTSGRCEKLPVNFSEYIKELRSVYDLYEVKKVPVPCSSEEQEGQECFVEQTVPTDASYLESIDQVKQN